MRDLRLAEHIYFCAVGDERIFLDLATDRYFSLPAGPRAAFRALEEDCFDALPSEPGVAYLLRAGILVHAGGGKPIAAIHHPRPTRSLVESLPPPHGLSIGALVEVLVLVTRARRALRKKQLPDFLESLAARHSKSDSGPDERDRAVAQFRGARSFVPIAPNCLYDSLALARFLQRRGIASELVVGAKLHPFAAHAWVQHGATVLNDSLGHARDFEPILVA